MADFASEAIRDLANDSGIELAPNQLNQLARYVSLLVSWNRTINLTSLDLSALSEPALSRLIVEPLLASRCLPNERFRWLDLGSGGGSPAVPLKVMRPEGELTMVESRSRKAAFLRETIRECRLSRTDALNCRIEELPGIVSPGTAQFFTIRAVRLDARVAATIAVLGSADTQVLLFGPVDWSALQATFERASSPAPAGTVLLTRKRST